MGKCLLKLLDEVAAETVVGAATGCVPTPKGYFPAMQKICQKHGALLILDEVMSGMGRMEPSQSMIQVPADPHILHCRDGYFACLGVLWRRRAPRHTSRCKRSRRRVSIVRTYENEESDAHSPSATQPSAPF
jgi:hypothetical protein